MSNFRGVWTKARKSNRSSSFPFFVLYGRDPYSLNSANFYLFTPSNGKGSKEGRIGKTKAIKHITMLHFQ